MTNRALLSLFSMIALSYAGCGSSSGRGGPVTDGGASLDAAAPVTDAGGSGADAHVATDAGTAPPAPAACASPTVGAPVTVATVSTTALALARAPSGLAVVWSETDGTSARVALQRLDESGALSGTQTDIAMFSSFVSQVTVATDGATYVACAAGGTPGMLRCGAAPVASGSAVDGVTLAGATPALAYGSAAFLLAYTASGSTQLVSLDDTAHTTGATTVVGGAGSGPPALVATRVGYAVAFVDGSGAALYRLAADGTTSGGRIALGPGRAGAWIALATSGELVGAVWTVSGGDVQAAVVDATDAVTPAVTIGPGAMSYGRVSIAGGDASFAVAWSDFGGNIDYRALSAAGMALGMPTQVPSSWDDNANAIAAVSGGFLLAMTESSSSSPATVRLLACP